MYTPDPLVSGGISSLNIQIISFVTARTDCLTTLLDVPDITKTPYNPRGILQPKRYTQEVWTNMSSKTYEYIPRYIPKRYTCHPRGIYVLGIPLGYMSWTVFREVHTSWVHVYLLDNIPRMNMWCDARGIPVTQEVYPRDIPKTYIPLGLQVYLLCDTYTSWVARVKWLLPKRYRQEPKTYSCHPRRIPKRYTQDICTYTQDIYTSWVTGIPLVWHIYLLSSTC